MFSSDNDLTTSMPSADDLLAIMCIISRSKQVVVAILTLNKYPLLLFSKNCLEIKILDSMLVIHVFENTLSTKGHTLNIQYCSCLYQVLANLNCI